MSQIQPNPSDSRKTNPDAPDQKGASPDRKITSRQVAAIVGIALLVLLYVVTLIMAFVDSSSTHRMFGVCFFATIAVPLLLWIYTWMYGKLTGKTTIADLNIGGKDHVTDEEVRRIRMERALSQDAGDPGDTPQAPDGQAGPSQGADDRDIPPQSPVD